MSINLVLNIDLCSYPDARVIDDESGGGEIQRGIFIPFRGSGFKETRNGRVVAKLRVVSRAVEEEGEKEFDVLSYADGEYSMAGFGYYFRKHRGYTRMININDNKDDEKK